MQLSPGTQLTLPGVPPGLTLGAVLIPLQILAGDMHGLNTLQHQPQKVAAMEGIWQTERGAPLLLFAVPDEATRSNHFEVGIPKLAALILKHDADGEIRGLDDFKGAKGYEHPPVKPVFYGFRVMVGAGMLMLAFSWVGLWLYRRRAWVAEKLPRPLLWGLAGMSFSGWVARNSSFSNGSRSTRTSALVIQPLFSSGASKVVALGSPRRNWLRVVSPPADKSSSMMRACIGALALSFSSSSGFGSCTSLRWLSVMKLSGFSRTACGSMARST
jgi:hypothetical protein